MTKKLNYIIFQIAEIALVNYLVLFEGGFIYKTYWLGTFAFAIAFFHTGKLFTLYATIKSKSFSQEKQQLLFDLNMFIYLGFIALLFYHNCQVATTDLLLNYLLGLYMLLNTIIFLFEVIHSLKIYNSN